MRRIDNETAERDLFGPGKHGFSDGDIPAAKPSTRIDADWFNGSQEEPCNVVEGAGLTLDPDDNTQLLQAIRILAGAVITDTAIDADTLDGLDSSAFARAAHLLAHVQDRGNPHQVTLAQLGGAPIDSPALQGSPTAPTPGLGDSDVSIATTAFVQAAIAKGLADAGLSGGYAGSPGVIGWERNPQGVIRQWGRYQGVHGEGTGPSITFPIAFPNGCWNVQITDWNRTGGGTAQWDQMDCTAQVAADPSNTGFGTFIQRIGGAGNFWEGMYWEATGD